MTASHPRTNAYILIVEDDPGLRFFFERVAESLGHRTTTAATVREALTVLRIGPPSLVLLDCLLPDGHGEEVAAVARKATSRPHIVAVSSDDSAENIQRIRKAGAHQFLPKPVSVEQLRIVFDGWDVREAEGGHV